MYLNNITIKNYGPIKSITLQMPFLSNGSPKPVVLIGQNGSGKSILISHIVNALLSAKMIVYEDREVEDGKVFKYRSPSYITSGASYSYSKTTFEQNMFQLEWQLDRKKSDFESSYPDIISDPDFNLQELNEIEPHSSSHISSNFHDQHNELKNLLDTNCILYFPPNRFEEPGWLNYDNLINKATYRFHRKLLHLSNRVVINYSPLKDNQNWLLDLLFDAWVLETEAFVPPSSFSSNVMQRNLQFLIKTPGTGNLIHNEITKFLKLLFQTKELLRFGIGQRRARQVEILKNEQSWIQNIFNLSTGESILLNIFLSIIKDFDLTDSPFTSLSEIRGIVVIDEVDVHLHSNLQYEVLPQLLKLFPKIQFILTSHSPLFLLGLEKQLGKNSFQIINLPDGQEIDVESFSEFENAYSYLNFRDRFPLTCR